MKKIILISIVLGASLTNSSCRNKPSEISYSCQRLASCYSAFGSMVTAPQVKSLVENAQKSGDESTCNSAITELSKATGQQCPF